MHKPEWIDKLGEQMIVKSSITIGSVIVDTHYQNSIDGLICMIDDHQWGKLNNACLSGNRKIVSMRILLWINK
jgi:hypothetical protein